MCVSVSERACECVNVCEYEFECFCVCKDTCSISWIVKVLNK